MAIHINPLPEPATSAPAPEPTKTVARPQSQPAPQPTAITTIQSMAFITLIDAPVAFDASQGLTVFASGLTIYTELPLETSQLWRIDAQFDANTQQWCALHCSNLGIGVTSTPATAAPAARPSAPNASRPTPAHAAPARTTTQTPRQPAPAPIARPKPPANERPAPGLPIRSAAQGAAQKTPPLRFPAAPAPRPAPSAPALPPHVGAASAPALTRVPVTSGLPEISYEEDIPY